MFWQYLFTLILISWNWNYTEAQVTNKSTMAELATGKGTKNSNTETMGKGPEDESDEEDIFGKELDEPITLPSGKPRTLGLSFGIGLGNPPAPQPLNVGYDRSVSMGLQPPVVNPVMMDPYNPYNRLLGGTYLKRLTIG
ncbi:unnamed protein product [Nezara viridula]|uniref:Neuropeptide n=1 Tax=Nezara viridula TaxID=85310 RepID=A0A9P0H3D0_NEZVI|nr:unnamed protein product [Nezara viridula]